MDCKGIVKKWSSEKGHGLISCDLDGGEVWVHRRAIGDIPDLSVGDKVVFQKVDDGKSRGKFKAAEVRLAALEPRGRFKEREARATNSDLSAGQQAGQQLLQMLKQPQFQQQQQHSQQPPQLPTELLPQQRLQMPEQPSQLPRQSPQVQQHPPQLPEYWPFHTQQPPHVQQQLLHMSHQASQLPHEPPQIQQPLQLSQQWPQQPHLPPQVQQQPPQLRQQWPQQPQQPPQIQQPPPAPQQWPQQLPGVHHQQYPGPFKLNWPIKDVASIAAENRYYECLKKYDGDDLARMFVEADLVEHPDLRMGMAINILRHVLREKIGEEQFLWDGRFGSAEGGKVVANILEEAMANFLTKSGINFKTENALRLELGSAIRTMDVATPDFLLLDEVQINGQSVCWIDCKCTFGSARILTEGLKSGKSQMSKNLVTQSMRYNQAYGPGAFVYSLGFSEGLADVVAKAQRMLANGGQVIDTIQANGHNSIDSSMSRSALNGCMVPLFLDAALLDTKKLSDAIAQQSNRKQLERWHFPQVLAQANSKADVVSIPIPR